jgi:hypothetical protein
VQDVGFPGKFITHHRTNVSNFDKASPLDIVKDDLQSYYNFRKGIEAEGKLIVLIG